MKEWLFSRNDSDGWVAGCCGFYKAQSGILAENVRAQYTYLYFTFEQLLVFKRPVLFATTISDSYYDFVLAKCAELGLEHIIVPAWKNPGSGFMCGSVIVFPKDIMRS